MLLHGEPGVGKTSTAGQSYQKLHENLIYIKKPVIDVYLRMCCLVYEATIVSYYMR